MKGFHIFCDFIANHKFESIVTFSNEFKKTSLLLFKAFIQYFITLKAIMNFTKIERILFMSFLK